MKSTKLRVSAVALAFAIALSIAPASAAVPVYKDFDRVRDPIVRVIKKIRTFFGSITSQEDLPQPPRP